MSNVLDAGVDFIKNIDGNTELIDRDKLVYKIAEYYGVRPIDINNMLVWTKIDLKDHLVRMLDNNRLEDRSVNPIKVIEEHFVSLGMPIPGGYLNYKEQHAKGQKTVAGGKANEEVMDGGDEKDEGTTITVGEDAPRKRKVSA